MKIYTNSINWVTGSYSYSLVKYKQQQTCKVTVKCTAYMVSISNGGYTVDVWKKCVTAPE